VLKISLTFFAKSEKFFSGSSDPDQEIVSPSTTSRPTFFVFVPILLLYSVPLTMVVLCCASLIAGITEIDTRRLTRHLRSSGAMRGAIASGDLAGIDPGAVVERLGQHPTMVGADYVAEVTAGEPYEWPSAQARFTVAAYDFGIKTNILRQLAAHGCAVTVYPASTPASELLAGRPDGVFLSNGPGDPEAVRYGIAAIGELLGRVPVFGICLGHQLLGLALGLPTFKLGFGHHGSNHPVARLADGRVEAGLDGRGEPEYLARLDGRLIDVEIEGACRSRIDARAGNRAH